MAVEVTTEPALRVAKPVLLFEAWYATWNSCRSYDVTPDGQRFLMVELGEIPSQPVTHINVVLSWFEQLKHRVPVD